MKQFVLGFVAIAFSFSTAIADVTKFDKETEINLGNDTKSKISAGWTYDDVARKLTSPEGDLTAYLLEKPFKKDVEALSLSTWKSVNPEFDYKILQKVSPPVKDGWEEGHQIVYETAAKDNKVILTSMRVLKGTAYMVLVEGSNAAISKRASQLQIAVDTFKPAAIKKEDLSQNKIKNFSSVESKEMDEFIAKAMKELNVPGASVAIVQNGEVVYRKGFGVKELGKKDKVTPETLFMIGSTTKPLTTLMLAKLVEQGKLSWETPITKVLPSFELADKKITEKFLVKHTACACTGMPRRDLEFVMGSLSNSVEDSIQQMKTFKPTTGFGETFQYSNHLVAVGGLLGANVYGKGTDLFNKYENAMHDLVFAPLGMDSSRVRPTEQDKEKLASPHARGFDGKMVPFSQKIDDMVYPVAPAGSVWSNVDDLTKYIQMELRNGKSADGKVLFSEEQILKRRTPGVKIDDTTTYGLGLFLEKGTGVEIVGHGGNTLGFTHDLFFLPGHNVGMVVQTNAGSVNAFRNSLKQKLLELLLGASPKSEKGLEFVKKLYKQMSDKDRGRISTKASEVKWVADYVGSYENKDLGKVSITKEKNGFKLHTGRWDSDIASAKEQNGERLLALISAPWSGGAELRVEKSPARKLILDDAQMKYEFTEVKE